MTLLEVCVADALSLAEADTKHNVRGLTRCAGNGC